MNKGKTLRKRLLLVNRQLLKVDTEIETDQIAIKNNYVSVTPIHFDLTDYLT